MTLNFKRFTAEDRCHELYVDGVTFFRMEGMTNDAIVIMPWSNFFRVEGMMNNGKSVSSPLNASKTRRRMSIIDL